MPRLIAAFTEEVKDYFQLFYGGWETADYRNNADAKRNQNLTAGLRGFKRIRIKRIDRGWRGCRRMQEEERRITRHGGQAAEVDGSELRELTADDADLNECKRKTS